MEMFECRMAEILTRS